MIYIEAGVYMRVEQLAGRAPPSPLDSGFTVETAYRALGIYSPSETSECYFVLANDRNETWFISNRHLRVVGVFATRDELRFPLSTRTLNIEAPLPYRGSLSRVRVAAK